MRNTVVVTFDSLRADHCGFMGHDRETTPTLDRMAQDGLVFKNAVAPGPSTPESMPVVLTGEYPLAPDTEGKSQLAARRTRIRQHMRARETLAERFSRAGYATAAFTPNPYTSRYFGFDAGFDTFEDFMGGSRARLYRRMVDGFLDGTSLSSVLPLRVALNWIQREEVFKPWTGFYDDLIDWRASVSEPYFLWILLMDTHDPYFAPARHRTQSRRAMYHANWRLWRQGHEPPFDDRTHERLVRAYDDSIRFADEFLEALRSELTADDPLIVVHGDHGEAFGEHGTYGHHPRLYEENVHVPLVVDGVDGGEIDTAVSLRRLPELLETLALYQRRPSLPRCPADCRTLDGERVAARSRNWKYIRHSDGEETVYSLNGGEKPIDSPTGLETACQQLVRWRLESAAEQRRIVEGTRHAATGEM